MQDREETPQRIEVVGIWVAFLYQISAAAKQPLCQFGIERGCRFLGRTMAKDTCTIALQSSGMCEASGGQSFLSSVPYLPHGTVLNPREVLAENDKWSIVST